MSTKFTIYDSDRLQMYGDVFDSENIFVKLVNPSFVSLTIVNDNLLKVKNQHVNIKINKLNFENLCKEYLLWKNKDND